MSEIDEIRDEVSCRFTSVWLVAKRTWIDINENEILTRAAAIAFTALMALIPFLALVLTIGALVLPAAGVSGGDLLRNLEALLGTVFPPEAHRVIEEQIVRLQSNTVTVVSLSLAITIWLASGLHASVIDGLNRIYGIRDTRPWWKFRLTAIWMTIVQSVILLASVVLIFMFPSVVNWVGFTLRPYWIATAVTWLIIFLMLLVSFAITFAAGPDVKQAHKWVTPGAVFGAVIFMLATYGFRLYVQNLAHYDVTYGSLGGIMMLGFWFYICSLVLLVAGEVNKVCHYARIWGKCGNQTTDDPKASPAETAVQKLPAARRHWKFCPLCGSRLESRLDEDQYVHACTFSGCKFVDYNNPVPVVAALIVRNGKFVLVKRGVAPFVGRWCLPRGYLKTDENPKAAVVREVFQETGLRIRLIRMLNACNPSPKNFPINQVTMFYLAIVVGGELKAGSDAKEVQEFGANELPDICFGTDTKIIADWCAGKHGDLTQAVNYPPPRWLPEVGENRPCDP